MAIPKLEDCNPGFRASGFNLVVAVEKVEEKTAGGLYLPDSVKDKETIVQTYGRVVSMSPVAFDFANFGGDHAKVGDAIIFARLAGGRTIDGRDGHTYRIIADKDVAAVIEEDA